MATTKSRHSISTQNKDFDDSVSHSENELLKKKDPKNYHCSKKIRPVYNSPSVAIRPSVCVALFLCILNDLLVLYFT